MAHPPSYKDTIAAKNAVLLFSRYLDDEALINGSFVCRTWHNVMNAQIWEDPIRFIARKAHPFRKYVNLYLFNV
jgi:hypothetical protein